MTFFILTIGAQLKELEYALQRYMANQLKVNGDVRPINHEVLYVKWPRIKQGNAPLLVRRGNQTEMWTPEQLQQAMAQPDFKFLEMVANVGCYLREDGEDIKGGLYFTLQSIALPAPHGKAFRFNK